MKVHIVTTWTSVAVTYCLLSVLWMIHAQDVPASSPFLNLLQELPTLAPPPINPTQTTIAPIAPVVTVPTTTTTTTIAPTPPKVAVTTAPSPIIAVTTSSPVAVPVVTTTNPTLTVVPSLSAVPSTSKGTTAGLDCTLSAEGMDISPAGDQSVLLRHVINQVEGTVTVQLQYVGEAWVSFGFSTTFAMIPNVAVIGLPDEQTVKKYNMTTKGLDGVNALPDDQQTLTNTSIVQENGITILTYTQLLSEVGEVPVVTGKNTFIWAYGMSNPIGFHSAVARGGLDTTINECLEVGETQSPTALKTKAPTVSPVTRMPVASKAPTDAVLVDGLDCSFKGGIDLLNDGRITLSQVINPINKTVTVQLEYVGNAWVSFGFSETTSMVPNVAVIGLPNEQTVLKYKMDSKAESGVYPLPTESQTLTGTSIVQENGVTTLKFTQPLIDIDQVAAIVGENTFLWSYGISNPLASHDGKGRGAVTATFTECLKAGETAGPVTQVKVEKTISPNKVGWIIHGVLLALAWLILIPLAVSVSILKSYFTAMPPGFWFRTHRNLNAIGVLFTIVGFGISVYLFADENGGSKAVHFKKYDHHKIGLVVFLFAFIQAVSGFYRPSLPHKPDPVVEDDDKDEEGDEEHVKEQAAQHHEMKKSPQRIFFEYQHRIVGAAAMILGWINCASGFKLYRGRFEGPELEGASWAVVGTLMAVTVGLAVIDRMFRQKP
jgi:DOMON domain